MNGPQYLMDEQMYDESHAPVVNEPKEGKEKKKETNPKTLNHFRRRDEIYVKV